MLSRRIHRTILLLALLIGAAGMNYVQALWYAGTCGAAGKRYIDFGIRAYYAFTFDNDNYGHYRRPRHARDTRYHYNRFRWW